MAQSFFYEVRYLPETENIYVLELVSKDRSRKPMNYEQDSPNWINLLARQKSFRFDGKNGSFSAHREERKDKEGTVIGKKPYWSAYRKAHNAQAKKYIGQNLSIASLEKAAADLESTLKEKLGIDTSEKIRNTRRLRAASPEKQKITYLLDQNEKLTARNQEQEKTIKRLEAEIKEKDQIIHHLTDQKTRSRSKSKEAQ